VLFFFFFFSVQTNSQKARLPSVITLLVPPRKNEEPDSPIGLNANEDELMSSKKVSLLLSGSLEPAVEFLLLPFGKNENFPVVGDG